MKILSRPKGNAEEYGRWSVNPYKGCPHGCLYCYLKKGAWKKGLGGSVPVLKEHIINEEHAYHVAMAEIIENRDQIIKDGGLFMTFTSDPCVEQTFKLFCRISESAREIGVPVTILTKAEPNYSYMFCDSTICVNYLLNSIKTKEQAAIEVLDHCKEKSRLLAIGFTLTGHDELEPNAIPNEERIRCIDFLTYRYPMSEKCHVWASIEPVITFDASFEMIQQALDAGCTHFKIGLMTNNTKVCRNGFSYGGHNFAPYDRTECCQFVGYVMELTERYGATVYWKQSFVDFLEVSKKDPQPVHGMTAREFLSQWPHSVGKDWSIFDSPKTI